MFIFGFGCNHSAQWTVGGDADTNVSYIWQCVSRRLVQIIPTRAEKGEALMAGQPESWKKPECKLRKKRNTGKKGERLIQQVENRKQTS